MNTFIDSMRHGFTSLTRFSGRDPARRFWPYVGAVIALFFAAAAATMAPIMNGAFARMRTFAAEHPDQATVTEGPGSYSIQIHGNHPELMPDMTPFFTVMQVGCAMAVLLLAAAVTRRLHDRGLSLPATGVAWALLLVAFGLALAGRNSVVAIVIAVVLLDAAAQTIGILNQTRLFTLSPGARSRLNTVYVTSNFLGGAAGSAAATLLWSAGGWVAVCVAGLVASGFALAVWAVGRRGALVPG